MIVGLVVTKYRKKLVALTAKNPKTVEFVIVNKSPVIRRTGTISNCSKGEKMCMFCPFLYTHNIHRKENV
jgi:hypothetical protein